MLQAAEIEGIHNLWLVPDCCAAAAIYGHFNMMHGEYKEAKTVMFVDLGAVHTSCFIAKYEGVQPSLNHDV